MGMESGVPSPRDHERNALQLLKSRARYNSTSLGSTSLNRRQPQCLIVVHNHSDATFRMQYAVLAHHPASVFQDFARGAMDRQVAHHQEEKVTGIANTPSEVPSNLPVNTALGQASLSISSLLNWSCMAAFSNSNAFITWKARSQLSLDEDALVAV